eukprot:s1_g1443.t1
MTVCQFLLLDPRYVHCTKVSRQTFGEIVATAEKAPVWADFCRFGLVDSGANWGNIEGESARWEEKNMEFPVVTAAVAGVLGILQYVLMLAVGTVRGQRRLSFGDGDDPDFLRSIRRHGNLAENAALFIVLLALLELSGGYPTLVLIFGGLFVLARISHAVALSGSWSEIPLRPIGALGTIIAGTGTAGMLLYIALM